MSVDAAFSGGYPPPALSKAVNQIANVSTSTTPTGDIDYPTGNNGNVVITDSDVVITAQPGGTFDSVTFRNVNNVTLLGLVVNGEILSERSSFATNITIRGCDVNNSIRIYNPLISTGIAQPNGWIIEYNDLIGGTYAVGVFSSDPAQYPPIANTTIRYNKMGNNGVDCIRGSWFDGLNIHHNEIFGIIEDGGHNDGFQAVWGGNDLVFHHNYFHDNNCQPFFIKDGYVQRIDFYENLSIRNRLGVPEPVISQIWRARDVNIYNNTIWDDGSFLLRDAGYSSMFSTGPILNIQMHHNVMEDFGAIEPNGIYDDINVLNEHDNVFGGGWSWVPGKMGPGSIQDTSPNFNNWQIPGYGITWNPNVQVYGIAAL